MQPRDRCCDEDDYNDDDGEDGEDIDDDKRQIQSRSKAKELINGKSKVNRCCNEDEDDDDAEDGDNTDNNADDGYQISS